MPSKSFFTLPAESILKKKYGREALLGLATRYHGDNAMTVSHPSPKFSFEDRPPPYCKAKNCTKKKGFNIPDFSADLLFPRPRVLYKFGCISIQ